MQVDMEGTVYVKLEGALAELLVKVDPPRYQKFVTKERAKPALYVLLKKALYGTLQAALRLWKKITAKLTSMGFHINPYDSCVANKAINNNQCTILWHFDDIKTSHADPQVVASILADLRSSYGKQSP